MRALYLDCFAGASGDMLLGTLLDLGAPLASVRRDLRRLKLAGWSLSRAGTVRGGIGATRAVVGAGAGPARGLKAIETLVRRARLPRRIERRALEAFRLLGRAEARIHRTTPDRVHFHEVGAVDAIVDVVGVAAALEALGVDEVYASAVPFPLIEGAGRWTRSGHGPLPLPAPATLEILREVPHEPRVEAGGELVTPTGAALLKSLVRSFGTFPPMIVERVGYGAGARDGEKPNLLRGVLGRVDARSAPEPVELLEANVDDMPPSHLAGVLDALFEAGALDAWFTPVVMKKSRPAIVVSALAPPERAPRLARVLLRETSTIGVRSRSLSRWCLPRRIESLATPFGRVRVKIAYDGASGAVWNVQPETEDLRARARVAGVPLKEVARAAAAVAARRWPPEKAR